MTATDFFHDYAGYRCKVEWCDRPGHEHADRPHQGVLATIFGDQPPWRGRHAVAFQPVIYGHTADDLALGLTIIDQVTEEQRSILLEDDDVDRIEAALAEYKRRKRESGR